MPAAIDHPSVANAMTQIQTQFLHWQQISSLPNFKLVTLILYHCFCYLQVSSTDSLKQQIILLEKDVRAERIKSAALEEVWRKRLDEFALTTVHFSVHVQIDRY